MSNYFCVWRNIYTESSWVKAGGKRLCWRNTMILNLDGLYMTNGEYRAWSQMPQN